MDVFPPLLGTATTGTVVAACLGAIALYVSTAAVVERLAPAPRLLTDLGHAVLPHYQSGRAVTDAVGPVAIAWTLWSWWVEGDDAVARWVLAWIAAGFVFSTTLHVGTVVGDARRRSLFGGSVDSLMSNHTFNFGVFARAVAHAHGLPNAAVAVAVAAYGLLVIASREHYTVDVVLAWWCVACVG